VPPLSGPAHPDQGGSRFLSSIDVRTRDEFRPRQLPRAIDLKGRLLSCQSY